MIQRALGIDLGTTNSVMSYMKRGQPTIIENRDALDLTPSVVALGKNRKQVLVGRQAKARPENVISSVKRFIGRNFSDPAVQDAMKLVPYEVREGTDGGVLIRLGDFEYSPTEISSIVLRKMKEDAEDRLKEQFTQAVITVPAYFGERQVNATRDAGRMAGFNVIGIINEPTAASLAYGFGREDASQARTILVYDFGGGTFDISMVLVTEGAFTVLEIEGDNLLGGDDFDNDITRRMLQKLKSEGRVSGLENDKKALHLLRMAAEEAKLTLSSQSEAEISIPALLEGEPFEDTLTRSEFERLIQSRVEHSIQLTHKAILKSGHSIGDVDYILLVGGSTRVPLIQQMLAKAFGEEKIRKDVNPMQCVSIGAALKTAIVSDIGCPSCGVRSQISDEICRTCGTSILPPKKTQCPRCFLLNNVTDSECWKCGLTLVAETRTQPVSPAMGAKERMVDTGFTTLQSSDEGGAKCKQCGKVNNQGALTCVVCGERLIEYVFDITSNSIGIELADGSMEVLLPKGTNFPTGEPVGKDLFTRDANERRLEIPVFEGEAPRAKENQLIGRVAMALPEGLPKRTAINVALGYDADRTVEVVWRIRGNSKPATRTRLKRSTLAPEMGLKIDGARLNLERFIEKWKEQVTSAEFESLMVALATYDRILSDGLGKVESVDAAIASADELMEMAGTIRGADAALSHTNRLIGKFLAPAQRATVDGLREEFDRARAKADWRSGIALAARYQRFTGEIGDTLQALMFCRYMAIEERVAPVLQRKILAGFGRLEEAYEKKDGATIKATVSELLALWSEVHAELDSRGEVLPEVGTGTLER